MRSLTEIIQALISNGNNIVKSKDHEIDDGPKEITSIRLKPQTRNYLQTQSLTLGISVSQLINIILDGVVELEVTPRKNDIYSLYDRLIMLFDGHNISPMSMGIMLKKYGVTLSKIKEKDIMLDLLTPEMLKEISDWFGVRLPWLIEGDGDIYNYGSISWYKNPEGMIVSIIDRIIRYKSVEVFVLKNSEVSFEDAEQYDDGKHHLSMGFIIKYKKTIEGITFDKYEICEFQRWNYTRCRDGLKNVFLGLSELEKKYKPVSFRGYSIEDNILDKLRWGKVLPVNIDKILHMGNVWYPDDLTQGMKIKSKIMKYIEAYADYPSKHFSIVKEYDYDPESWSVSVFLDEETKHEYHWLRQGLEDLYEKYHSKNEAQPQSDSLYD